MNHTHDRRWTRASWDEAAKYQVLPLNNQPGRFTDRRHRRDRYELHAGIGALPEGIAPNLRGRRRFPAAELDVPATGEVEGAIVAHGSHSGGCVRFLRGRRLHYAYTSSAPRSPSCRRASSCRPVAWTCASLSRRRRASPPAA